MIKVIILHFYVLRKYIIKTTINKMKLHTYKKVNIENTEGAKCQQGWGETGTLSHCWWKCTMV